MRCRRISSLGVVVVVVVVVTVIVFCQSSCIMGVVVVTVIVFLSIFLYNDVCGHQELP